MDLAISRTHIVIVIRVYADSITQAALFTAGFTGAAGERPPGRVWRRLVVATSPSQKDSPRVCWFARTKKLGPAEKRELTRPTNIKAPLAKGTLVLEATGSPVPGNRSGVGAGGNQAWRTLFLLSNRWFAKSESRAAPGGGSNCSRDHPHPPNSFTFKGKPAIAAFAAERTAH